LLGDARRLRPKVARRRFLLARTDEPAIEGDDVVGELLVEAAAALPRLQNRVSCGAGYECGERPQRGIAEVDVRPGRALSGCPWTPDDQRIGNELPTPFHSPVFQLARAA